MQRRRRRSIRWKGFHYASPRAYYVTVCVHQRRCLLGAARDERIVLSSAGRAVDAAWRLLPARFGHVALDEFVIMPNHVHGIIRLRPLARDGEPAFGEPLGEIVRWFKARTTRAYIHGVRDEGWPAFDRRLWQRGFHDRVIRDEEELAHARAYIFRNPARWSRDPDNPQARDQDPASPWDDPGPDASRRAGM